MTKMDALETTKIEKESNELNIPLFLVGKEFASIGDLESGFSDNINYIIHNGNNGKMSPEFKKTELSKLKNALEILHSRNINFQVYKCSNIQVCYCETCNVNRKCKTNCSSAIALVDDLITYNNKEIGIKIHKKKLLKIGFNDIQPIKQLSINERTCHGDLPYCGEADGNCSECRHPSRRINKDTEFEFVDLDAGGC